MKRLILFLEFVNLRKKLPAKKFLAFYNRIYVKFGLRILEFSK